MDAFGLYPGARLTSTPGGIPNCVTSPSEKAEMAGKTGKKNKQNKRPKQKNGGTFGLTTTKLLFPSMFRGKMSYEFVGAIAPAAGSVAANVFRFNSVYDPDFTGVGATAAGYGQASALYGRYRVLATKITAQFVNTGSAPLTCFMVVNPVTTVGINIVSILQQRHVWSKSIAASTGNGTISHTIGGPVARFYGVPARQVRDEDDFAAVTGANPNNGVFCHIGAYADGAAAGAFTLHVRIEYDVVWSLPLELV